MTIYSVRWWVGTGPIQARNYTNRTSARRMAEMLWAAGINHAILERLN